ncbi:hypothetical protein QOT17_017498 [Balamuthia mandrillaris]
MRAPAATMRPGTPWGQLPPPPPSIYGLPQGVHTRFSEESAAPAAADDSVPPPLPPRDDLPPEEQQEREVMLHHIRKAQNQVLEDDGSGRRLSSSPSLSEDLALRGRSNSLETENLTDWDNERRITHIMKLLAGLVQGETTYISELDMVVKVFFEPLRNAHILDRKMMMEIFSTIEFILKVHLHFWEELRGLTKDVLCQHIGSVFLRLSKWYKLYCMYCDNFETSFTAISKAKNIPAFQAFWKAKHKDPALKGEKLTTYLSKPLHRVLKYNLFFKELFKYLPADAEDYDNVLEAGKEIGLVADYIKNSKVLSTNLQSILNIYYRLSGLGDFELVSTSRTFIREGNMCILSSKGKEKEFRFFLFSDVLLFAKKHRSGKDKYFVKEKMDTDAILVREELEKQVKKKANQENCFQIVRMDDKKFHTVVARSKREKTEWMRDLNRVINDHLNKVQKTQRIPANLDEVIDVTVSFLLWGVLPSSVASSAPKKQDSRNRAFLQRRPTNFFLPAAQDSTSIELNTIYPWANDGTTPNACGVAEKLLLQILDIYRDYSFLFTEFGERATCCIFLDPRYEFFVRATGELSAVTTKGLTEKEKLVFFLNLYHIMMLHAHIEFGGSEEPSARLHFLNSATYVIDQQAVCLTDVEFRILKAQMNVPPDLFAGKLGRALNKKPPTKVTEVFALRESHPLINFSMSQMTRSSPAIRLYNVQELDSQLAKAAESYLEEFVLLYEDERKIQLPKILEWYGKDFIAHPSERAMLEWCTTSSLLNDRKAAAAQRLLAEHRADTSISFYDYNWEFLFRRDDLQLPLPPAPPCSLTQEPESWEL